MATIHVSTHIRAPMDRIYNLATDAERWPQVIGAISKVEVVPAGPVRVGTKVRETRKMFGKDHTETMEFLELNPPHSYVLGAMSGGCDYRTTITLVAENEGTRVSMDFVATPRSFFARMFAWMFCFMKGTLTKCLADDLADLKKAAEGLVQPAPSAG